MNSRHTYGSIQLERDGHRCGDDRTDPEQAQRLAEMINAHGRHARAIVYPEYGHQIPVEARSKDIDPFIERVLNR